jgi:membrane fusion protein, multidrug efflux system
MRRLLAIALLTFAACQKGSSASEAPKKAGGPRGPMEFPVEVAPVEARSVEVQLNAVGSIEAFEEVVVTARVPGVVERLYFAEGDQVKEGAKLVEIEPRRYQIAVDAARAAQERAAAQEAESSASFERRQAANKMSPGLVKEEELANTRTRLQMAKAAALEAKSALDLAELNLRDAFVRAPVAGTIETRSVRTGQYVQPGASIATLVRRDPLLLRFEVPEADAASLRPDLVAHFTVQGVSGERAARITHVAQAANPSSRMVRVMGHVEERGRSELRPGAFAEVRVPLAARSDAPVVPQTAVRPSERGFLVFTVEEGVAKARVVELGLRTADGMVEVRSGLAPGEKIVVRGSEALRDGAKVRVISGSAG